MGVTLQKGRGVTQDYAEAVRWYRLAAAQGCADAQYNLGFMFRDGLGVTQDNAEAVRWIQLAAVQGDVQAQMYLGIIDEKGHCVAQDYAEALVNSAMVPTCSSTRSSMRHCSIDAIGCQKLYGW
jgi:hypothetical protein